MPNAIADGTTPVQSQSCRRSLLSPCPQCGVHFGVTGKQSVDVFAERLGGEKILSDAVAGALSYAKTEQIQSRRLECGDEVREACLGAGACLP